MRPPRLGAHAQVGMDGQVSPRATLRCLRCLLSAPVATAERVRSAHLCVVLCCAVCAVVRPTLPPSPLCPPLLCFPSDTFAPWTPTPRCRRRARSPRTNSRRPLWPRPRARRAAVSSAERMSVRPRRLVRAAPAPLPLLLPQPLLQRAVTAALFERGEPKRPDHRQTRPQKTRPLALGRAPRALRRLLFAPAPRSRARCRPLLS